MEETFPQIKHVILDEVQNSQTKDGDWLRKARALVKQHIIEREFSRYDFASDSEGFLEWQSETEQDNSDTNFVVERYPQCSNDDHVSDNESDLPFSWEFETERDNSDTNFVVERYPQCSNDDHVSDNESDLPFSWEFETEQGNSDTNFVVERYPKCSNDDHVSDNESDLAFSWEFETEQDNSDTNCVAGLDPECSISQNDGPGDLWCSMDRVRGIYELETDIPEPLILMELIRYLERILSHWVSEFLPEMTRDADPSRKKTLVTTGHDFDGEGSEVGYSEGERIARLIEVLESLLIEGYSKGDIAVLCFTKPLEGYELDQRQEFTLTVNAERNDDDNIVLSTVREYGGLERPVVIIVDKPFNSSGEM